MTIKYLDEGAERLPYLFHLNNRMTDPNNPFANIPPIVTPSGLSGSSVVNDGTQLPSVTSGAQLGKPSGVVARHPDNVNYV